MSKEYNATYKLVCKNDDCKNTSKAFISHDVPLRQHQVVRGRIVCNSDVDKKKSVGQGQSGKTFNGSHDWGSANSGLQ